MPTWEVRKVSGKGILKDTLVAAYRDLSEKQQRDLKLAYDVIHVGKLEDFFDPTELYTTKTLATVTDADIEALPTTWQGKPLPNGMNYCVFLEGDAGDAQGSTTISSVRRVLEVAKDKMVMSDVNNRFTSGDASNARKTFAQTSRTEGGVWGVKRRGGLQEFKK